MTIDKLLFLHIPKTAGTNVQNVLHRHFSRAEQIETNLFTGMNVLSELLAEHLKQLKLVRGHFAFGEHKVFGDVRFEYCTLLREPVDRCVSHYFYNLAQRNKKHLNISLRETCESGDFLFVDNIQVRLLSGHPKIPVGTVTRDMMEHAWQNLNAYFPVTGIMEQFDAFLLTMCDRYSLALPYYRKQRVNKDRKAVTELDEETRRAVASRNLFDIELYDRVKQKVMAEIEAKGKEFQERVQKFQKRNVLLSRVADYLPFTGKVATTESK